MVFTRRGRGGGRGGGEVEVKRHEVGICPKSNPRRSSLRLKSKGPKNYIEVEDDNDKSFNLSDSAQPIQLSKPAQGNMPFNILKYCYARREVKKTQGSNRKRTPRRVELESLHFERNGGPTVERVETQPFEDGQPYVSCTQGASADDEYATLRCREDFAEKSPKGMAGALGTDDIDEVLHDAADTEATEADTTTGHEVPIGSDGNIALQNTNDNPSEKISNMASNHFDDDQGQGGRACNSFIAHHSASKHMTITEIVEEMDDGVCDIDSLLGSEVVYVEGYKVKPHYAMTLRTIISKHGDICANCSLKSVSLRSLSMELLCDIVLELKASDSILQITEDKILDMQSSICDMESQKIEVGWLKTRLNEILGAKHAILILKQSSGMKMRMVEWKAKVKALREQRKNCEKDIHGLQQKLNVTMEELSHAQSEAINTEKIIKENRAKFEHMFKLGTLINDLA